MNFLKIILALQQTYTQRWQKTASFTGLKG